MKQTEESQSSWYVWARSAKRSLLFFLNPALTCSHRTSWMPTFGQKNENLDSEQSQSLLPQFMRPSQPKPGEISLVNMLPRFQTNLSFKRPIFRLSPSSFDVRMNTEICLNQHQSTGFWMYLGGAHMSSTSFTWLHVHCDQCQHSALEIFLSFADVFSNIFCYRVFHRLASCKLYTAIAIGMCWFPLIYVHGYHKECQRAEYLGSCRPGFDLKFIHTRTIIYTYHTHKHTSTRTHKYLLTHVYICVSWCLRLPSLRWVLASAVSCSRPLLSSSRAQVCIGRG